LLATSATNCGISSTLSLLAIRYGFPATLVDLMQEMGCVCRGASTCCWQSSQPLPSILELQSIIVASLANPAGHNVQRSQKASHIHSDVSKASSNARPHHHIFQSHIYGQEVDAPSSSPTVQSKE
jgi:hypothetical protein